MDDHNGVPGTALHLSANRRATTGRLGIRSQAPFSARTAGSFADGWPPCCFGAGDIEVACTCAGSLPSTNMTVSSSGVRSVQC